ncbi:MAG: M15 family metallopeptidase [Eubacterium sp.]|nr:M15 family metallopeptidase [Eubacterium sp.]
MDYNDYRDGYWLGANGAWNEKYYGGRWRKNSHGWWYEDASGWNPVNQWLWINGVKYWFGSDGYLDEEKWALILVNQNNPVPDNYSVNLTTLSNGKRIDSRIYSPLQEMFSAARASGLDMYVREGYRTRAEQQSIMDSRIQQYVSQGYSYSEAVQLARQYVAIPGRSEHELGICVDINATYDSYSDDVYAWLDSNAYKYGFIKRYPQNKSHITGISYEPWHYRYVGRSAAAEMYRTGMCLEEYLACQ